MLWRDMYPYDEFREGPRRFLTIAGARFMLRNRSRDTKDFDHDPLGNMVAVGAVEARSVRLWMRTEHPGVLTVSWWPEDDTEAVVQGDIRIPEVNTRDNTMSVQIRRLPVGARPYASHVLSLLRHPSGQ